MISFSKSLKSLDIHTKAKSMFVASDTLDMYEEEKQFRQNCLSSYINTVAHMMTKLPFNTFLKNCLYIRPLKRNEANALGGISNVTLQVSNALNNVLPNVFPTVDNILSSEDVCDNVRSEWRLYQTEIIPEDVYLNEKEVSKIKTRRKISYWEKAFVTAAITEVGNIDEAKSCDIKKFVLYLEKDCTSNDGKMKYPFLVYLFKLILSLSHGDSAPENGFSISKLLLEIHGSSLKKETIKAIRIVKDSILKYESILDILVTKEMVSMIITSRQIYMGHLEQKPKEEENSKNESEKGFAQEQNIELQNIELALAQIQCGFKVADESVSEGNAELKALLLKNNNTMKELQKAQNNIEMGMKCRQELQADEEVLNKRKKN